MALFSFKAAALAVRWVSAAVKLLRWIFKAQATKKRMQKFLQSDWTAQGFKAKKCHQAAAQQKKAEPADKKLS